MAKPAASSTHRGEDRRSGGSLAANRIPWLLNSDASARNWSPRGREGVGRRTASGLRWARCRSAPALPVVEVTGVASGSASGIARVFVLDSEVGSVTDLVADGKDPAWSPDGKWIAFTREVGSGAGTTEEVWLTAADPVVPGQAGRRLPEAARHRCHGNLVGGRHDRLLQQPAEARDFSVPVDKPETVTVWKAIGDQFPDLWYPVVAPDGRYVAYHADGQLRIADMAAGKIVGGWPLDGWRGWLGGWSPDGSRLGYGAFGGEDKGLWELPFVFLGNLKLSPPRRILSGSCTLPSWSPDGSKLAFDFRSPQRGYEVWMVDTKRLSAAGESTTSEVVGPTVRVFRLRHAKAQDVVQEIRRMLPRGGLGADSQMNAIVVSGDAETLKIVGELIEKLDVAPPEPAAAAKPSERGEGDPTAEVPTGEHRRVGAGHREASA